MGLKNEHIHLAWNESFRVRTYPHRHVCSMSNWHIHPEFELVYVHNGSGEAHIGSSVHTYTDGLLALISGNSPHRPLGNSDFENNYEVVVHFNGSVIKENLGSFPEFRNVLYLMDGKYSGLVFSALTKKNLGLKFKLLQYKDRAQQFLDILNILNQIAKSNEILQLPGHSATGPHGEKDAERFREVLETVRVGYRDTIDIDRLSFSLGLTKNSFSRWFKSKTGRTFKDFLNEYRIVRAQELLVNPDLSISEVMYLCGFNNHSYFSKRFKSVTGQTPLEFQYNLRKNMA